MNKVFLIGRLTKEPELSKTKNDKKYCTFPLAVNDGDEVNYFTVTSWNTLAENCDKYLVKGQQVAVVGKVKSRTYEKDGKQYFNMEVNADSVEFLAKPKN